MYYECNTDIGNVRNAMGTDTAIKMDWEWEWEQEWEWPQGGPGHRHVHPVLIKQ